MPAMASALGVCVTERAPGGVAFRDADCNLLSRDCWVLLAAGLLVSGLCVLCALFGSFLLLQKQNNHREHREHRAAKSREEQGRADGGAAAGRPAIAVRTGSARLARCG
jgi:hypothetical protein